MITKRKPKGAQPPADVLATIRRMYPKPELPSKPASEMSVDEVIAEGQRASARVGQWIVDNHPLARKGAAFNRTKQPGDFGATTRYLCAQRLPGETPRELWNRLSDLGASHGEPVYFDGDVMIESATEKEISYRSFDQRLRRGKAK